MSPQEARRIARKDALSQLSAQAEVGLLKPDDLGGLSPEQVFKAAKEIARFPEKSQE